MGNPVLAPVEASKRKSEPSRVSPMKAHGPAALPSLPNFLGAPGNMAIQRAASGPLGNAAAPAILGGANMSSGGCSCGGTCAECSKKPVQRKADAGAASSSSGFHSALHRSGPGTPLASHTRGLMESRFGETFDDVRVHDDHAAADAARHIQAHAFTTGRDIYFGQGRYQPHSTAGQKLLAHELTHVLQQRRGVVAPGLKSMTATAHNDIFEREAEQVEAHIEKEEHGVPAALSGSMHPQSPGGKSLQRKCACGGTCSKCSGETTPPLSQELKKPLLQRKAESNLALQERAPQEKTSQHTSLAEKKIQRKCACGGTCSKCSGETAGQPATELKKPPIQRKAAGTCKTKDTSKPENSLASQAKSPQKANAEHSSSPGKSIQRKCACGGTCSKCSGKEEESKIPVVQRKAETGEGAASRDQAIQRKCACGGTCSKCSGDEEGKAPAIQRKPENTTESAGSKANPSTNKALRERLGPKGGAPNDISLGHHLATPQARNRGNRPIRSGRRPAAAIQRASSPGAGNTPSITRSERLEREAHAAANEVVHGRQVPAEKISNLGQQTIQPVDWEFCNPLPSWLGGDPDCGVVSTAGVIGAETAEIASEVWDEAKALAHAVGGFLSYVNNLLTITIPPQHILNAHSFQVPLPELALDLPFLVGALPIAPGVEVYGEVGLHLGLIPEIGLQLGPFDTHAITIALHPLTLNGEVTGGFDLTIAGLLGGEARAGIFGEVGVIITWPDPPFVLKVPIANIQAGLAGTIWGTLGDKMSIDFHAEAGILGFDFDTHQTHNLGAAVDLGLAGYGKLSSFGFNLCTLKWPLYSAHADAATSLDLDFGITSVLGGLIVPHKPDAALHPKKWDDLGIQFSRQMHKKDCPLCGFLYDLGLMPSQNGGKWTGHPAPPWSMGPLFVYPRDPLIPSESLCRGACGPNCETCKHEKEHRVCVPTPDGCHMWWVYPNYELCQSHLGCRNHDACYDWCAGKGYGKGKYGIYLSPCHRLCDFECICQYDLPQCVGWIGGQPPYDYPMVFSDMPRPEPGCRGPCPTETKTPSGVPQQKLCLPDVTVIGRHSLLNWHWSDKTKEYTILSVPLEIPYIPPPTLDIYVRAGASASVTAGIGPVTLEGLCLIYDPASHAYSGKGSLHLKGDLGGRLSLTGTVGAKAGWGCLGNSISLEVVRGEASLVASAFAHIPLDLSLTANVSCRGGKLMLDLDAWFKACLDLYLRLDASLRVLLFRRWEIFSDTWKLWDHRWGHCWNIPLGVTSGEIGPAACGGRAAAGALGLPASGGPPPDVNAPSPALSPAAGPGPAGAPAAASPASKLAHAQLGHIPGLSVPDLVKDMFKLATDSEVINDKTHGSLPADPAKESGKPNPCGDVKPDDECGTKKLPLSRVPVRETGSHGQGKRVKSSPLTKCEGDTHGSRPDPAVFFPPWECIRQHKQTKTWVHAHLLQGLTPKYGDRNLHGPGDEQWNLIISDRKINREMVEAEQDAVGRIFDNNEVLWYESKVDYMSGGGDLDYFAESITVSFGKFNTDTGQEEPTPIFGPKPYKRNPDKVPPQCPPGPQPGAPGTDTSNNEDEEE